MVRDSVDEIVSTLVANNAILDDGESVVLDPDFAHSILEASRDRSLIESVCERVGLEVPRSSLNDEETTVIGIFGLLGEFAWPSPTSHLTAALAIDHLYQDPPETDGAPTGFVPIRPAELELVSCVEPAVIAYFWRHDCPPCDQLESHLSAIHRRRDLDFSFVAINGTEAPRLLRNRSDVVGAPTLVFFLHGRPDMRLIGLQSERTVAYEIDKFCQVIANEN